MKAVALIIGIALLAIGAAGFLSSSGMAFGVLPMDTLKSVLFVVTGLVGVGIGLNRSRTLPPTSAGSNDMRNWM
jgi:hypothetical protein